MSTTVQTTRRPASPANVVALQMVDLRRMLAVPLGILVAVVVVMVIVTTGIVRAGGHASDTAYNGAVLWSIGGFIVALGVQGVSTAFPFALALGSTRRTFVLGTLIGMIAQAALLTAASLLLLGLELVTGGWFVGARVLRDQTLGGGDPLALIAVMFLTLLTALTVGGVFGAAWVRFGAPGPLVLGLGIALAVALALLLLLPAIVAAAAHFEVWWLAVEACAVILVSIAAQYLLLRRASVR